MMTYVSCTVDDSMCSPTSAAAPHFTALSGDPSISRDNFQLLSKPIDLVLQRRFRFHHVPSNACSRITSEVSL
ncbi:hypothetical protein YC2023_025227 [Brassica napus]